MGVYQLVFALFYFVVGSRMARPRSSLLLKCLPYVAINLACSIHSHRLHRGLWALFRTLCIRHQKSGTVLLLLEAFSGTLEDCESQFWSSNNICKPECQAALLAVRAIETSTIAAHCLHTPQNLPMLPLSRNTTATPWHGASRMFQRPSWSTVQEAPIARHDGRIRNFVLCHFLLVFLWFLYFLEQCSYSRSLLLV